MNEENNELPRCVVCQDEGRLVIDGVVEMDSPCEMCQFTNGLPRPVVVRFAEDMEQRLSENDYKGGWSNESKQDLANLLAKATGDLLAALAANEGMQLITTRAADVANISMMIANNEQLGTWPKNGVVIQDMDTGLYLKADPEADGSEEFPFVYVDRVDKSERYEATIHATYVAFWYGEIGRHYRVIDYDNGGVQYIHAGGGRWAIEGAADRVAIPAERKGGPVGD